jgi:hypothetical protein
MAKSSEGLRGLEQAKPRGELLGWGLLVVSFLSRSHLGCKLGGWTAYFSLAFEGNGILDPEVGVAETDSTGVYVGTLDFLGPVLC